MLFDYTRNGCGFSPVGIEGLVETISVLFDLHEEWLWLGSHLFA